MLVRHFYVKETMADPGLPKGLRSQNHSEIHGWLNLLIGPPQ